MKINILLSTFVVTCILVLSCNSKNKKQNEPPQWEFVKPKQTSSYGEFDITVNGFTVTDYIRRNYTSYNAGDGNKYILLNITYTNISTHSARVTADGLVGVLDEKQVEFDDNIIVGNWNENINPGVKETFEIAYKVPKKLNGKVYFVPFGNINKCVEMNIDNVTMNAYN